MQKIRDLMTKCGLSEEAADSICEAIQAHVTALSESLEQDYNKRAETAKRICVEETEAHKLELGRRMQIFCEAKANQIEALIAKQAQAREGQAVGTLEQIKGLLEGISIADDSGLKAELKNLREQNEKLQQAARIATERANRQTALAEKVLRRNRLLEAKHAVAESEQTRERHTVLGEGSGDRRQPAGGGNRRIDTTRQRGTPATTRRTLAESQDRHEHVERTGHSRPTGVMSNGALSPVQIAQGMEDGPPI